MPVEKANIRERRSMRKLCPLCGLYPVPLLVSPVTCAYMRRIFKLLLWPGGWSKSHLKTLDTHVDFVCLRAVCRSVHTEIHTSVKVQLGNVPGRHVCWRLGSQLTWLFWESAETLGGRKNLEKVGHKGVCLWRVSCPWSLPVTLPLLASSRWAAPLQHAPCLCSSSSEPCNRGAAEPWTETPQSKAQPRHPPPSFLLGTCLANVTRMVIAVEN